MSRSYIDFLGFAWNMLLVAFAVIIYFTGAYMDHKHKGDFFRKSQTGVKEVLLHPSFADRVQQSVDNAIANNTDFGQDVLAARGGMTMKQPV
jgi:hypothetical protein